MTSQKKHYRTSKRGLKFNAGKGYSKTNYSFKSEKKTELTPEEQAEKDYKQGITSQDISYLKGWQFATNTETIGTGQKAPANLYHEESLRSKYLGINFHFSGKSDELRERYKKKRIELYREHGIEEPYIIPK